MNTTSWIRAACVLAILAGALVEGQAQTAARVPRVGILELYRSPSPPSTSTPFSLPSLLSRYESPK